MNEVRKFLNSLKIDNYVILGCSGGPDSMALLDVLIKMNIKVVCAHVNHNIRKESITEYEYLEKFAKDNNIIFEGITLEKGNHSENYYRKKRYDFYKNLAKKYNTKYIMTAHHGDDLIETILMRISRGTNLKGYAGFKGYYEEKGFVFIKPLLYTDKEEILNYNEKNKICYFVDKTNESSVYTRNRYRKNILPKLKEENKDINKSFLSFSKELFEVSDYLVQEGEKALNDNYNDDYINLEKFNKLDKVIQKQELNIIFSNIYGDNIDKISKIHIDKILEKIKDGKNFELTLPLNYLCKREYDKLYIITKKETSDYKIEITDETYLPNGDVIRLVESSELSDNYIIRLNKNDIKLPLYIRNRKTGDKIAVKNLNGYKKVKAIFIDEKIGETKRKEIPLLVDSDERILWIPGIKKSKFDINKDKKCDIILKYERKEK